MQLIKADVQSSTHFLRHSAIQHLRDETNSLDIAQAFGQHTDRRTVEKTYGKQPVDANKKATAVFADIFKKRHQEWKKTGTEDDSGTISFHYSVCNLQQRNKVAVIIFYEYLTQTS